MILEFLMFPLLARVERVIAIQPMLKELVAKKIATTGITTSANTKLLNYILI